MMMVVEECHCQRVTSQHFNLEFDMYFISDILGQAEFVAIYTFSLLTPPLMKLAGPFKSLSI